MAQTEFQIFKITDSELLNAYKKIAADVGETDALLKLFLLNGHKHPIDVKLNNYSEDQTLKEIFKIKSSALWRVQLSFPVLQNSFVIVEREAATDKASIHIQDQIDNLPAAKLIASTHKHLRAITRTESIDRLLGDELAEFYRRREESLLRLEELSQKLIEQNEEYRKYLDSEYLEQQKKLREEYENRNKTLEEKNNKNDQDITAREEALQKHIEEIDDRGSKHARRQLRNELKEVLANRSKVFSLTKNTTRKRLPIHGLFIALLCVFGFSIWRTSMTNFPQLVDAAYWVHLIKLLVVTIGFTATVIFYIRWNDNWFRQHADEEFDLKRLDLDIDRASWLVEMALEWKEEKGTEFPEELVNRLTQGLFTGREKMSETKHPHEDLASLLLSASRGLTIRLPGLGELTLDSKGLKKFENAAK